MREERYRLSIASVIGCNDLRDNRFSMRHEFVQKSAYFRAGEIEHTGQRLRIDRTAGVLGCRGFLFIDNRACCVNSGSRQCPKHFLRLRIIEGRYASAELIHRLPKRTAQQGFELREQGV